MSARVASIPTLALSLAAAVLTVACSGTASVVFDDGQGAGGTGAGAGASTGGAGTAGSGAGGIDPSCSCGAPASPVCGVDGETYDAACGEACVPVEVACEGACPCASCDDIAAAYRKNLEAARQCMADLTVPQCTAKVPGGLPCGCNTYVNPSNAEAYQALLGLLDEWEELSCAADVSCEACADDPVAGTCEPDSGNARVDSCVDVRDDDG